MAGSWCGWSREAADGVAEKGDNQRSTKHIQHFFYAREKQKHKEHTDGRPAMGRHISLFACISLLLLGHGGRAWPLAAAEGGTVPVGDVSGAQPLEAAAFGDQQGHQRYPTSQPAMSQPASTHPTSRPVSQPASQPASQLSSQLPVQPASQQGRACRQAGSYPFSHATSQPASKLVL